MSASRAIARRSFADSRVRNGCFALFFGLIALVQVAGYEHSFPTRADRLQFAQSFGSNKAIRLFYGAPHDLLHVGGYVAWRVGGTLAIFAAAWGIFAAVRALRSEEDAGRAELVMAGPVGRLAFFAAALGGVAAGGAVLLAATWLGLAAGGLPAAESGYLALAVIAVGLVFAALGALLSQLAASRRLALGIGLGAVGAGLMLRVVADTAGSLEWLRWATPLGWAEELRPFAAPDPRPLLLFAAATAALLAAAARLAARRDVGTGLLAGSDTSPPRLGLLSSPTALALRGERGTLLGWLGGLGFYAVIVGLLADTFTAENLSSELREELHKVGGASIVTPAGALGFYFLMFAFAIALFTGAQVSAARHEEADSRLETLLVAPLSRRAWLGGRLALAALTALALSLAAGVLAWAAAATQGAGVSLGALLEAGLNCMPVALLFLGLSALAFAAVPRATAAVAYGLVSVAFCWDLFGALLGVPTWTLDLSPFRHIGLVPAQPFKVGEALAMLAIGALAAALALWRFERRDVLAG